jgi:hypothetical protein
MVDLKILEKHGLSPETLKETFTADKLDEKANRWIQRARTRIQQGRDFCFQHYRLYWGIDQAFDVAFKQLSPTLAQSVADKLSNDPNSASDQQMLKVAMEWGLTHMITDRRDPKTGKVLPGKQMNLPVFWNIIVPLAPAYMMIRVSKQVNDRNRDPYLRYEPFRDTAEDRFRCEIITDWVRMMTANYGYQHIGNQAILKAAMYGDQLMFPQQEWHEEKQLQYVDGKEKEKIVREGIPYYFPHPSRTYWDRSYPATSMNTDTGSKWAGNWRIQRAGELRNNPAIWNRETLRFPEQNLQDAFPAFFNTVYSSCAIRFPQMCPRFNDLNREQNIEDNFYTQDFDDYAIVLTDHYEEIIPKEWGFGDYPHPVWVRCLMANDITPIYMTPLPSIAPIYFGYSPEDSRLLGTSLMLELTWAQDHVSNLMTQTLLSVKQNLANLTFVNEDVVDEDILKQLENISESQYRKLNLFRYSDYKFRMGQNDKKFESISFPKHNVNDLVYVINALLGLVERVNVISAQEVGSQATHEQSATEQRNITASTSNKAAYFAFQIDKGLQAWKKQIYNYSMAYADEEVWAQVPADKTLTKERLEKLGFTVDQSETETRDGKRVHMVKGKKTALMLQQFAGPRMEDQRFEDGALATSMVQLLGIAFKEQIIAGSIGPHQAVRLFNAVLAKFHFPEDFRLTVDFDPKAEAQQSAEQFQQQLSQFGEQVQQLIAQSSQEVVQQIGEAMKPIAESATTALNVSSENKSRLDQLYQLFQSMAQPAQQMSSPELQPTIPNADVIQGPPGVIGSEANPGLAQIQ